MSTPTAVVVDSNTHEAYQEHHDEDKDNVHDEDDGTIQRTRRWTMTEHILWMAWGIFCAILGWVFTDKLSLTESVDDVIPKQRIAFETGNGEAASFVVRDLTFDEEYTGDTVSTIATYIYAGLVPIVLQAALAYRYGPRRDLYHTVLGYLVTFGTSLLASEPVKWYVAYRRPNFYQVCEPDDEYTECTHFLDGDGGEGENPREAIFSFPSGHSSTAFAGLTFFALYLHARFGLPAWHREQRHQRMALRGSKRTQTTRYQDFQRMSFHRAVSYFGFVLPMALAVFISVSRIVDQRHFPADVLAGALIGAVSAAWVFPLWYYYDTAEEDADDSGTEQNEKRLDVRKEESQDEGGSDA